MKKVLTGALTALTLIGATAATLSTASAAPRGEWRGGHSEWRGDRGGDALAAGLLGLGLGMALSSGAPAYGPPAYYVGPSYYGWYRGCRTEWRWNPRWRGYQRVGVCY